MLETLKLLEDQLKEVVSCLETIKEECPTCDLTSVENYVKKIEGDMKKHKIRFEKILAKEELQAAKKRTKKSAARKKS